jgi:hypothetical protein
MAAPKRTTFQRERDLEQITSLYLTGKTQQAIADVIGVSRQQISLDIQAIKKRWRESSLIDIGEAKNRELDRLDKLEQIYWSAWENSLGERTRTKQETSADGRDEDKNKKRKSLIRASVEKETMLGNPAYLAGIEYCISERCKIVGLYAPTQSNVNVDVTRLSEDELQAIITA